MYSTKNTNTFQYVKSTIDYLKKTYISLILHTTNIYLHFYINLRKCLQEEKHMLLSTFFS